MSEDGRIKGMQYSCYNRRKVVACLKGTTDDAFKALASVFHKRGCDVPFTLAGILLNNDWQMNSNYVGKAKLHPCDGYNEEYGKALAKIRCLSNYHKDFDNIIRKALYQLRVYVASIEQYCYKHNIDTTVVPSEFSIKKKIFISGCNKQNKDKE